MKCMLVLAFVAVAAAKPAEILKPVVELQKQPILAGAYSYPVAHSLPLTYATGAVAAVPTVYSSPIAAPFLAVGAQKKPELKIQPVMKAEEMKVYEKPMEVKAYAKPMEVKTYAKPMEVKIAEPVMAYAKPVVTKFETPVVSTYAKPVVTKFETPVVATYAKPVVSTYVKPVVSTYAKPIISKFETPVVATTYAKPAVVAASPIVSTPVVTKKLTYAVQPVKTEYVAKPYEIPVKKVEYVNAPTGCKNNFGVEVPCKKFAKREAQHLITAPITTYASSAIVPTPYYNAVPAVVPTATAVEYKALPTKVQKVEVPQPYYKEYVEKVALKPNCMNDYGMAVPCIHYE